MAPPAAWDRTGDDGFVKIGNRTAAGLQDDAMPPYEFQGFWRGSRANHAHAK